MVERDLVLLCYRMSDARTVAGLRKSAGQLARYGLVGVTSNLLGYLVYLLLTSLGVQPILTMTLLYAVGATIGFVGNRLWVFSHTGAAMPSGARYCGVHLLGYLINFIILFVFVTRLGYPHQWVQAMAIIIVASFLFIAHKYFVFSGVEKCKKGVG